MRKLENHLPALTETFRVAPAPLTLDAEFEPQVDACSAGALFVDSPAAGLEDRGFRDGHDSGDA